MATRRRAPRTIYGTWGLMVPEQGGVLDKDDVPLLFLTKAAAEQYAKYFMQGAKAVRVTVRYPLLRPPR